MLPRATVAWCGSTSSEMIEPPSGNPAAMAMDEYPVKVPISSTRVAWVANTSSSRKRPSWRPTIIPQAGKSSWVEAYTAARCSDGAVECASAYASVSGSMSSAMPCMVRPDSAPPAQGPPSPRGPPAVPSPRRQRDSVPDLDPEPEQSLHVEDVGVEEGHGDQNVRRAPQLGLLLGLTAGHHPEVEEALGHLAQHPRRHHGIVRQPVRQGLGPVGQLLGQLGRLRIPQVVGQDLVQDDGPQVELALGELG